VKSSLVSTPSPRRDHQRSRAFKSEGCSDANVGYIGGRLIKKDGD
jgi:hypothetical protein